MSLIIIGTVEQENMLIASVSDIFWVKPPRLDAAVIRASSRDRHWTSSSICTRRWYMVSMVDQVTHGNPGEVLFVIPKMSGVGVW